MATLNPLKRRSMDAISHPETQTHMRLLRGASSQKAHVAAPNPAAVAPLGLLPENVKRMAMDAISNVETVAQVGLLKMTGGVALYAARIREVDREAQRDDALRKFAKAQENKNKDLVRD